MVYIYFECYIYENIYGIYIFWVLHLDLVLSTEKDMVDDIAIGCPVGNSDHNLFEFTILENILMEVEHLDVYCYHKGNYLEIKNKVKRLIR